MIKVTKITVVSWIRIYNIKKLYVGKYGHYTLEAIMKNSLAVQPFTIKNVHTWHSFIGAVQMQNIL